MNCKNINKKIIFYLDKNLNKEEYDAVKTHLDGCASCKALTGKLKDALMQIELEKDVRPDPYFYTRLQTRINSENQAQSSVFSKIFQPAMAMLLILVAILSGIVLGNRYFTSGNDQLQITENQYYTEDYYLDEYSYEGIQYYLFNSKNP